MEPWKIISDQEVESIHNATLRVLSEVGIVLDHPKMREQLADTLAAVEPQLAPFSPELKDQSIDSIAMESA